MVIMQIALTETLPTDENIFVALPKEGIEQGKFGLWWRRVVRFFYLEVTGEAVLRKKTDRRNAISIYISITDSFTSERAFFVTKLPSAIPNSFTTAIALSLECRPAKSGISPPIFRDHIAFPRCQIFSHPRICRDRDRSGISSL